MNIFGVISPPIIRYSFISIDLSLHYLFKGWWYLHTTEEGPGISRSEGGLQQIKCHFVIFILFISPLNATILFSLCCFQHPPTCVLLFCLFTSLISAPVYAFGHAHFVHFPFENKKLSLHQYWDTSNMHTSSIDWNNIIDSFVNRWDISLVKN